MSWGYRLSSLILVHPKISGLFGPVSFALACAIAVAILRITASGNLESFFFLRAKCLILILFGYAVLLLAFPVGFLVAPRTDDDFLRHAKGFHLVRLSFDVGETRVRDGVTDGGSEAEEVFKTYMDASRHYFLKLIVSYIFHVAAVVVLGAAFTWSLVYTARDPAAEIAILGGRFSFDTELRFQTPLDANLMPADFLEHFNRNDIPMAPQVVSVVLRPGTIWRIHDRGRAYVVRMIDGRLKVYEMQSFLGHLYFSAVTIFTIGFGEIHPISDTARAGTLIQCFTLLMVIVFGLSYMIGIERSRVDGVERAVSSHFGAVEHEAAMARAMQGAGR